MDHPEAKKKLGHLEEEKRWDHQAVMMTYHVMQTGDKSTTLDLK